MNFKNSIFDSNYLFWIDFFNDYKYSTSMHIELSQISGIHKLYYYPNKIILQKRVRHTSSRYFDLIFNK